MGDNLGRDLLSWVRDVILPWIVFVGIGVGALFIFGALD